MSPGAMIRVACHDLMFRSKVETTLGHMGHVALTLRAADDPAAVVAANHPVAAIVDLGLGEERWRHIVAAVRAPEPPIPVLAFGSHVDRAMQAAARQAGCDLVVANSRLARELPDLVDRLITRA